MAWLQRTGNAMAHSTTRKIPLEEWQNEQHHLRPWVSVKILPSYVLPTVRKDNTFAYLGNFYSVPQGTFRTKDTMVMLWLKENELHVHDGNTANADPLLPFIFTFKSVWRTRGQHPRIFHQSVGFKLTLSITLCELVKNRLKKRVTYLRFRYKAYK